MIAVPFRSRAQQLRGTNGSVVKLHNRSVVIRALLQHGPLSRHTLAHLTGLMPSTITYVVAELSAAGLVRELGPDPSATNAGGGRQPILIDVRTDGAFALAIEFAESFVRVGLVNLKADIQYVETMAVAQETSPHELVQLVGQLARRVLAAADGARPIGVGVAAPGLINPETGINEFAAYHRWHDVPLAALLTTEMAMPVHIQNNARAMALAEHWYGAGRLVDDLISITVMEGVGAGIIIGGRIYTGWSGFAGEIGHTVVVENGPLCACGKYGCLEAIASTRAIARRAQAFGAARSEPTSTEAECIVARVLADATAGQQEALAIVAEPIHHLALAIANLTVVIDPQLVILSGDVLPAADLIVRMIGEAIDTISLLPAGRRPKVVPAALGAHAGLIGAATLVFERVLDYGGLLSARGDGASAAMAAKLQ